MDKVEEGLKRAKEKYDEIPIPNTLYYMTRETIVDMNSSIRKPIEIWKKGLMAAAAILLTTGSLYTGVNLYQHNQEQKAQLSRIVGKSWEDMDLSDWEQLREEISNAVADVAAGNEIHIELGDRE